MKTVCASLALLMGLAPHGADMRQPAVMSTPVRIWGNPGLGPLLQRWTSEFNRRNPQIHFEMHLTGSDTGIAGLYSGVADLALLGREITDSESKAFEWIFHHPPLRLEILHGGLDQPGKSPALVVLVHKDNPLERIDFRQLAAIFLSRPSPGITPLHHWSELGLGGEWAHRAITLYTDDTESGTGRFFRHAALADARLLNWERLQEFHARTRADGTVEETRPQILAALGRDRFGLGISSLPLIDGRVRTVPVAAVAGGPYLQASALTVAAGSYPLGRTIYAYVDRRSQEPMDPRVHEFLRYVLSADAQGLARADDGYLPLHASALSRELERLGPR